MWIDGKLLVRRHSDETTLDLAAGTHSVTLAVDRAAGDRLRIELTDIAGSKAQAQIVGGK